MVSDVKNVQILVAILKQYNIKQLVLSPGNRDVPFVHSVENDPFFECYSITDERSAAFFAIGLIRKHCRPVGICCTSGTAVCNYASAVNEAFYQRLPLLVITADRNPYFYNQFEDQMIDQVSVLAKACKKSVQLPIIKDETDTWFCVNQINVALLELDHHGTGPVHINVPIDGCLNGFHTAALPDVKKIERINGISKENVGTLEKKLFDKRIMIVYGQNAPVSREQIKHIKAFSKRFNSVIAVDLLSNLNYEWTIRPYLALKCMSDDKLEELVPNVVISLNGNFVSDFRRIFKLNKKTEHWLVSETGEVQDPFRSLSTIIETTTDSFFDAFDIDSETEGDYGEYYYKWKDEIDSIEFKPIPYSDTFVVNQLMKLINRGEHLHLANSSTVRTAQLFALNEDVIVTCNRGTNGIDGSMSSFVGESYGDERLHYLIIGDLSFFYDMNALWNRYINKNMRILLNNNEGAGIFFYTVGRENVPSIKDYISAEHFYNAEGWAKSAGFAYLSIRKEEDVIPIMEQFVNPESEKPILLEVFTKKEIDADVLKGLYSIDSSKTIMQKIKQGINKVVSKE